MLAVIEPLRVRPCLVLAHSDPVYAAVVGRAFRQLGWHIRQAYTGAEVRELAWRCQAQLVVLDTQVSDETGWLTCAKLIQDQPQLKVVLVSSHVTDWEREYADFVGAAALCNRQDGSVPLVQLALELMPVAAG